MQLFLASILACAALLAGILAQTDWKPYSTTEDNSVAMPDDSRTGIILADSGRSRQFNDIAFVSDNYPSEFQIDHRDGGSRAPRTLERTSNVAMHRKERTRVTESAGLLARHDGHAFTLIDANGRTVKVKLDFDEHSFEMLAVGLSKEKHAKIRKLLSTLKISEMAERELRKEFARDHRVERNERRSAQRDLSDEPVRAEPAETRREQGESLRSECPEKIDRTNP